jgi:hypothetical protein
MTRLECAWLFSKIGLVDCHDFRHQRGNSYDPVLRGSFYCAIDYT